MEAQESKQAAAQSPLPDENPSSAILKQLKRIEDSHAFRNSARAKEFLSYVVKHGLGGHDDLLKERSIGVNLFHRAPSYVTSDDPIVRVKAADVRRRLAQYYAEEEHTPEVLIEIPVGTYIPKFQWRHLVPSTPPAPVETSAIEVNAPQSKRRAKRTWMAAAVLAILGVAVTIMIVRYAQHKSPLEEFWAPVFTNGQPVLICLATPVSYAVNSALYFKPGQVHPGMYDSLVARSTTPLQLDPNTPLKWKDLTPLVDYSVNKDDAYVAANLSAFFAQINKPRQVRIGNDFTYEDLRSAPAVLIGAFNNPWTMRMAKELPFGFHEQDGTIVEKSGQGRVWRMEGDKRGTKDFAVVARVLNSKTGQFLVIVAGTGMVGTEAAGKVVSDQKEFEAVLRTFPNGWQAKNLEVVLESDVIDGSASPSRVVAVKSW
jgi:hypothetical protein